MPPIKYAFTQSVLMDVGAIAFYRHEGRFKDLLYDMKTSDKSFSLSEPHFKEKYGYSLQSVFQTLYSQEDMWGFVGRQIKKRNGSIAYKIITEKESVIEVPADDIYFALQMNDYGFTHWAEMSSFGTILGIKHSKQGKRVLKTPSNVVKKCAEHRELKMMDNILYQIVKTQANKWGDYYPTSNFNNSKWLNETPYYDPPNPYTSMMKSSRNYTPWDDYTPNRATLHAIPYNRDNIQPTSFKILKQTSSLENQLFVFANFPNGIPMPLIRGFR